MQAMVCELCGSNDIIKKDGLYICQHCGTKYTVEEARKLIGTVKIDKSSDLENWWVLARRARESRNVEQAAKYYSLILNEEPNHWEPVFFSVYFASCNCKLAQIPAAGKNIRNAIAEATRLLQQTNDGSAVNAMKEIASSAISFAETAGAEGLKWRKEHRSSGASFAWMETPQESLDWAFTGYQIYDELENDTQKIVGTEQLLTIIRQHYLEYLSKYGFAIKSEARNREIERLNAQLKKHSTSSAREKDSEQEQKDSAPSASFNIKPILPFLILGIIGIYLSNYIVNYPPIQRTIYSVFDSLFNSNHSWHNAWIVVLNIPRALFFFIGLIISLKKTTNKKALWIMALVWGGSVAINYVIHSNFYAITLLGLCLGLFLYYIISKK